jgi:PAS domain S-box-containing protein
MFETEPPPAFPVDRQLPAALVNILESISDVVVVLDSAWRFVYVNRRGLQEARQPRAALIGQSIWEKFPELLGGDIELYYRKAMVEQQPVHFETDGLLKERRYEVHAYPSPESLTVYGRDITDRWLAEEQLRQSKNFMDNSPAVAFMKNERGEYVYINKVFEQRLKKKPEDVIGRTDFEIWPPGTAQALREADSKAMAAGKTLEFLETVPDPDGTDHFWRAFKFLFQDAAGARYVGGMAVDITEQKRAEAALQEYADRLQALSRRLLEVQEAERRYLARELHDEVGQVLTGLQLSLQTVRGFLPDEARQSVEETQGLLKELAGRVRDLSLRLRPTMLDDLGLLPALLWHLDRLAIQGGVHVIVQQSGLERRFPPEVETAAYRIVQEALTNIDRHAGVHDATLRLWCDQKSLHIEVKDAGKGFEPERVRAEGKSSGLSGMNERAVLLGGRLEVESRPNAGTRIGAVLPTHGGNRGRQSGEEHDKT